MNQKEEPKNAKGQTWPEFLAEYKKKNYPAPYLSADNVIFTHQNGTYQVLLIRRGDHPFIGQRALPGGFVNPDESAQEAAARELQEETHLTDLPLAPAGFYSKPGRDPRGWNVSRAFFSVHEGAIQAKAGDDARDAAWFDISEQRQENSYQLTLTCGGETCRIAGQLRRNPVSKDLEAYQVTGSGLAFDHAQIISDAWLKVQKAKEASA